MQTLKEHPVFSLVIPTYNERRNLPVLVARLIRTLEQVGVEFEIIIVDDDSPDETWKLATDMAVKEPRLRVIRRQGERGLATAVVAGWKEARGEILGVMDGDLQYPPEGLPLLLKAMAEGHADIVVGSRYAPGAKVEQWSLLREIVSRGAILLAKMALPGALGGLLDPNSGYFLMRRGVIENIDLRPIGYKILIEVLARGRYGRVVEIGLSYQGRKEGLSKLGSRQTGEFLLHLARLAWETGELRRLVKFCLVGFSGVFVNLGVLWILTEIYGAYYLHSAVVAVECAIANNFIWNEFWTFADKTQGRRTILHRLRRFFKFNLICSGGALLYVGVMGLLTHLFGIYYLMSAIMAIGAVSGWNYILNANITWLSLNYELEIMPASKPRTDPIRTGYPPPLPAPGRAAAC